MNNVIHSAFAFLLDWLRSLVYSVWQLLQGGTNWLTFLGENWLKLTILLLVVCTVVDIVVYLLRWRPMRVWGTFFRHLRGEYEALPEDAKQHRTRRWMYADGSVKEEIIPDEEILPEEESVDTAVVARVAQYATMDKPEEPAVPASEPPRTLLYRMELEENPEAPTAPETPTVSEEAPVRRRRSQTPAESTQAVQEEKPHAPSRRRTPYAQKKNPLRTFLGDEEEEVTLHYKAAQGVEGYEDRFTKTFDPNK